MPSHLKKIGALLFCSVLLHAAFAQTLNSKLTHKIGTGFGIGITKYFGGFAFSSGYEAHLKNYFAAASVNSVSELQIFSQEPQTATDLSLMLNRSFTFKPVSFTAGAGLAGNYQYMRAYNFYKLEPGTPFPDDYYSLIKKFSIGFPVDLQLMVNIPIQQTSHLPYVSVGVGSHSNFNALNTMHCFYFKIGVAFK